MTSSPGDRVVAARKLIAELVKAEQIEVRRVEIVGRDLAKLVETLKRPPTGQELGDWLDEHAQVTELYAPASLLDELVYRHLTPPPDEGAAEARHPDLERQIRDTPDATGPYLVYADWLQENSDPLGELIALGVASAGGAEDDVTRFERHLKRYEARFLGGLAGQIADRIVLRWRNGLVQAIEESGEPLPPRVWTQLVKLRVCELLESITLRRPCTPELDQALAEAAPESLRALVLEEVAAKLPPALMERRLRSLVVHGTSYVVMLENTTLPATLERLELRVPAITSVVKPLELGVRELDVVLTERMALAFADVRAPRVERLTLHLEVAAAQVPALLAMLAPPALTHLGLCDGLLDPKTFEAIAKLTLAEQITSLALTNLELTDETIQQISGIGGFTELATIDVSFNELSRDGLAAAKDLAPEVTSQRQHRRGNGMERRVRKFAGSRLQAAEAIAEPKDWKRAFVDGDIRWARYRGEADYELFISADLARYGCSCPSSIQPCKHVVALALLAERTQLPAAPSRGIADRLGRRLGDVLLASLDVKVTDDE